MGESSCDCEYDCIVVGAGIIGCSAAYQLVKKGCKTLLLEQFPLPHTRGSSHGQTRVLRFTHPEDVMVEMVKESYQMWQQLEREAQTQIYKETGMLLIDLESSVLEDNPWDKAYTEFNIPHEILSSRQMCTRYNGIQFHDNYKATFEKWAGTLSADKALICYQDLFKEHGGILRDGEKVLKVVPGHKVRVKTSKGWYSAKQLVLSPGPWAAQLVLQLGIELPLKVECIKVCYWGEKVPGSYSNFPVVADLTSLNSVGDDKHTVVAYGLPSDEYPGLMKMCLHHVNGKVISDPDDRDKPANCTEEDIEILSRYIREHFPGLEDRPRIVEPCLYTTTPDCVPIIDKHPMFPNIAFACGMSGAGFKFAPVYGKVISQLILGEQIDYDMTSFRHDRFKPTKGTISKSKL